MKKLLLFALESITADALTGIEGILTQAWYNMDGSIEYVFQPCGKNPKTGAPAGQYIITSAQINPDTPKKEYEIPEEMLGTKVKDTATGFKGNAAVFAIHLDGCVHVRVQPTGVDKKTGGRKQWVEFDLRRLSGEFVPKRREPSPGQPPTSPCGEMSDVVSQSGL